MRALHRFAFASTVLTLAAQSALATGTLLGSGTLNTPNDLTRVLVGSVEYQYLDLTATAGQTIAAAVGSYGPSGFHWASGAEVAELFSAFGFNYAITPGTVTTLNATATQRASFIGFLGATTPNASLGWIDDLFSGGFNTYACISVNAGCGPDAFVNNRAFSPPPVSIVSTFLVRPVPEPSALLLMACGIGGMAALRSRARQRNGGE